MIQKHCKNLQWKVFCWEMKKAQLRFWVRNCAMHYVIRTGKISSYFSSMNETSWQQANRTVKYYPIDFAFEIVLMLLCEFWNRKGAFINRTNQRRISFILAPLCGGAWVRGSGERLHGMQEVTGSIPVISTRTKALHRNVWCFSFCWSRFLGAALLRLHRFQAFAGGSYTPPTFDFTPFSKRNVCRPFFSRLLHHPLHVRQIVP